MRKTQESEGQKMQNAECKVQKLQRLIDANKVQAVLVNMAEHLLEAGNPEMAGAVGYAAEVIGKQPTVDAVEVVHGEWGEIYTCHGERLWGYRCSNCEADNSTKSNYCPNCGAKMDGDGNA